MTPAEDVAARILALVAESPNKTINGGRLSELLKHYFTGFTPAAYGAKNLRAFVVDKLAGKLHEIGRVGTDIVYGLPEAVPLPSLSSPRSVSHGHIPQEALRVFRSPNAPFDLYANRETAEVRVATRGAPLQDPWIQIKPASPDDLRQIVRDFVADLPREYRDSLTPIVDESPWWPKFSLYLQEKNLYSQWLAFKGKQLRLKLESELRNLGVAHASSPPHPRAADDKKDHSEVAAYPAGPGRKQAVDELRDVIIKVVQGLPISDLRKLRLPVGQVYDALNQGR